MRHRKSLRELVRTSSRIEVRDWSGYDSEKCHDGGHYCTGVDFYRHGDGWERQEYTSGDYCPYCGSFDCCGSCEGAEWAEEKVYTDSDVLKEIRRTRLAGNEIEFF